MKLIPIVRAALTAVTALFAGSLIAAGATTQPNPFDGDWHFSLTPYLWLPNINADLSYDLPPRVAELLDSEAARLDARIGPNDWLSSLKFGLLLAGEARKGPWSVFTDIIYLDLGNQDATVRTLHGPRGEAFAAIDRQSQIDLSATVWTLGGGYTLAHGSWGHVDALAGFRYLGLDTDLKWQFAGSRDRLERTVKVSRNEEQWDGLIGVKGQILFANGSWFMPFYLDLGAGSSNLTWQAMLGAGYRFGWGDVTLAIRSLSYDFDEQNADVRFTGPMLGATFRW
ncbi:MAG TPA: hypothetical protein VES73_17070 [Lamprocystis sp. (in: g-proteobacteria)]|nr:hypothetical protein [Lamprocystis sp. (in: g-proteobacteria)]